MRKDQIINGASMKESLPAVPFVKFRGDGTPYLAFQKCGACGTMFLEEERLACGRCGTRGQFSLHESRLSGTLQSYSIVHRSFPGTPVPFISAVVDLDGGPAVKGNLRGVPFDPDAIAMGMRVKVLFDNALGRTDDAGHAYVCYFFEPAGATSALENR
jgi:uncharacterized OB-fold protein